MTGDNSLAGLRSLSPQYSESDHREYVEHLIRELQKTGREAPRNIALTGHYGSGKSSILMKTQTTLEASGVKVVNLSLPSLGIGSERLQVGTENELSTTNLIQKEIVKQLLYRRKPSDTPASRYNRLDVFQSWTAYRRGAGVGVALTGTALLGGVPEKFRRSLPGGFWNWLNDRTWSTAADLLQWASLLVVFILGLGAAVWLQRVFHQRIRLTELAAGPATVSLSEDSTSFFDEFLDEIVYFFQNSNTTVVIFEDLDRFKDPHIFETLRELNMLLNHAEQTGKEPIQFVYAIRDSIFEHRDGDDDPVSASPVGLVEPVSAADRRLMSTNRTKFFDLVIPVVPFISHRTSRDLITKELAAVEGAQRPSTAVIDLVSIHLTDMRLIKNICNEYDVFRRRILSADGLTGLESDRLFASIVYKNLYLDDYEKIRNGESALDDLYAAFRAWVAHRAAMARTTERKARARLNAVSTSSINNRSRRLGERLQEVIAARGGRDVGQMVEAGHVAHAGINYTWAQLCEAEFWRTYLNDPQDLAIAYRTGYPPESGGKVSFADLQTLMNESLSPTDWKIADRAEWREKMTDATKEERAVAQASMKYALSETSKSFPYGGSEQSLLDVAQVLFAETDLVVELLQGGYLDENFALYVTQFPNEGSAAAMNFVLKAVQPNVMDIEYHFGEPGAASNAKDIDAVLRAEGNRIFDGRSIYNIEIFDRLLATDPSTLDVPIRRLALNAGADREFIEAYLTSGRRRADFARHLAGEWHDIFAFVIGQETEVQSTELLDAALLGAGESIGYEISDLQRAAFTASLPGLKSVTQPQTAERSAAIATAFAELRVRVEDLSRVAEPLRGELVARNLYILSRANLETILGAANQLSLDLIKSYEDEVFAYSLANLGAYLAAIAQAPSVATISSGAAFADILVAVEKIDTERLTQVAQLATDGISLFDIEVLSSENWPAVVAAKRMRLTVRNVRRYWNEHGLDDALLELLSESREYVVGDTDTEQIALALQTLNSAALSDDVKLALIASLGLDRGSISPADLKATGHRVIPRLVGGGWMEDNADAFICLSDNDWPIKEELIARSAAFIDYLPSLTLDVNELLYIATRPVPDEVRGAILDNFAQFAPTLGPRGAQAYAAWAARKELALPSSVIVGLATKAGLVGAPSVMKLLSLQASTIDIDEMKTALNGLGGVYGQLTSPGRDRPKIPISDGVRSVLARLQRAGIVSRIDENLKKGQFQIFKRYT